MVTYAKTYPAGLTASQVAAWGETNVDCRECRSPAGSPCKPAPKFGTVHKARFASACTLLQLEASRIDEATVRVEARNAVLLERLRER